MEDERAVEIIRIYDTERTNSSSFMNLYQETANLMFPRENQITSQTTPGSDKSKEVYDDTAKLDSQDMASGLSAALIPSGQKFCSIVAKNKILNERDDIRRYLSLATDITHDELFASNFMLNLNESFRSLVVFGSCNLYSEWDNKSLGLNFKDWDLSYYEFLENNRGIVDTIILKFPYTARQATQEFGENAGEKVKEAMEKAETQNKVFPFIHCVRPRKERNPSLSDTYNLNMPFESLFINVEEKIVVEEGGFPEFPFAVARWMKSSGEKWGRGQGTEILSTVKTSMQNWKDLVECGNKHNNPPREVLNHFEGSVRVTPGACNVVREKGTIRALEQQMLGNFPITREMLEFVHQIIHRGFYADVFAPLANLPGDRRTTVEIYQRVKQAMNKLGQPVYRVQSELLNPLITRCVLLLIRNGRIPYPPKELQGKGFGIEYIGELALALKSQQSKAFIQWSAFIGQMDAAFPEMNKPSDNIDSDSAIRRMARSFGVHEEDIATEGEVAKKRRIRQQELMEQKMAMAAQVASDAYKKTTSKPEEGSPAEEVMAGV